MQIIHLYSWIKKIAIWKVCQIGGKKLKIEKCEFILSKFMIHFYHFYVCK